ncbi:MAG: ferrous iron transport protein B [Anaerolineae bacterium]|nr:ferrous iron transport protein B [Anaerolineae bacterium]
MALEQARTQEILADLMGERRREDVVIIALTGNPNVGKSTLFNALTGQRQHTGNWPGKTVELAFGEFEFRGESVLVVDLPGTYSLAAQSPEEVVARDFVIQGGADVVIDVVDATNLERNLNLALQLFELTDQVVVALNLIDEAERSGIHVDAQALSEVLGVPVVPIVARDNEGVSTLVATALDVAHGRRVPHPARVDYGLALERAINQLAERIRSLGLNGRSRWVALKLLEDDPEITAAFRAGDISACCLARRKDILYGDAVVGQPVDPRLPEILSEAEAIAEGMTPDARVEIVRRRYVFAHEAVQRAVRRTSTFHAGLTDRLDRIVTHRLWSWPIMLAMLALVFWITIKGANIPSEWLAAGFDWLAHVARAFLEGINAPWWVEGLLVDALIVGLGAVISVMLPPMVIFFTAFALMEDWGFLPRVAFNLDRLMRMVGSQGKQCLVCAMSYGCNITGVMSARIIDNEKDRLVAILTSPLIICNGRFGAGIVLVMTLFRERALFVMLSLVLLSLGAVFLATFALNNTIFRDEPGGFVLELPPYRMPQIGPVVWRVLVDKVGDTMLRAVEIAAPTVILIWLMGNFPRGAPFEQTPIGWLVHALAPLGRPWQLSGEAMTALLFTLPAKEIVVPSLAMTYGLQSSLSDSRAVLDYLAASWTPLTAYTFMVFYMLYLPCLVTTWATWRETRSLKWTAMGILVPLTVATVITTIVFQVGRLIGLS